MRPIIIESGHPCYGRQKGDGRTGNEKSALLLRQIGGKVAYYRKLRNLTQAELAGRVSVSTSVISRLERGRYSENLPLGLLLNIAGVLDIPLSFLLAVEDEQKRWQTAAAGGPGLSS